ncbi:tpt-domain-containing protein [Zymoseptoria brevis]|uniref:Tpt-domain-containing protein n=1 Tax=Zymoseptoria brevis TaxID=1047168 RepID=A0A0F4GDW5_9PEZI|nr:tpt-domain-containing protein [Zymoseptoria brevis]
MQKPTMNYDTDEEKVSLDDGVRSSLSESWKEHSSGRSTEEFTHKPTDGILKVDDRDVESQGIIAPENYVSIQAKLLFLAAYMTLNLFLTLSNKAVLTRARFPWLLTALHASATSIGCLAMLGTGYLKLSHLGKREQMVLVAFSLLFTINIAISNVSLAMVSVPFHQIMRSTCPVVTILIYRWVYGREYGTMTYFTMIPLIFGCAVATAGDYNATILGSALTLLGVVLASVKTVASNQLMTGSLKLSALEILLRMSPLAAIQCVSYAFMTGEVSKLQTAYLDGHFSTESVAYLLINAITAFLLNIVGFQANKMAGALTITVCGNVKQALTILFGIVLFHVEVGVVNGIGMIITILGAVWYSKVELDNKQAKS